MTTPVTLEPFELRMAEDRTFKYCTGIDRGGAYLDIELTICEDDEPWAFMFLDYGEERGSEVSPQTDIDYLFAVRITGHEQELRRMSRVGGDESDQAKGYLKRLKTLQRESK